MVLITSNVDRNIFIDLDGVMADFEGYFQSEFGIRHDEVDDAKMWHHIDSHSNFFGSLPLMKGSKALFEKIIIATGRLPFVLTACPKTNYARHAINKIDWVHENLHPNVHVLPVLGGKNKALFMKKAGDVLIDDFEKNLIPWQQRGGIPIHHTSIAKTTEMLQNLGVL